MKKKIRKTELLGLLLGNTIEFYDFTIYAFMAPFIKKNIFPSQDSLSGFLLIFSIFSSGYFVRPLGSIFFGHIGDKYSRDTALIFSVGLASFSTIAIGLVPSYEYIGVYSIAILLVLRMLQGLSVSGEEGGSTIRIYETLYPKNRGISSSLVISTVFFGVLLGSIVCYGISSFIETGIISEYFWRLPFLLAFPLGVVTLYIRVRNNKILFITRESPDYPIKGLLNKVGMVNLLSCYSIGSIFSILTATLFVYVPYFLKEVVNISSLEVMYIVSFGTLISIVFSPIFGYLSDLYSEDITLKVGVISSILLLAILFPLLRISYNLGIPVLFLAYLSMAISVPSTFSKMLDKFDKSLRYTGISLSLNMAIATFSGTLPVTLVYLTSKSSIAPGILVSFLLIGFYSLYFILINIKSFRLNYEKL